MQIKQVLADFKSLFGGAECPFCGKRCELRAQDLKGKFITDDSCEHVDMAVHAGGLDIAISFVKR